MTNISDKQLLKELKTKLEERKKYEEEISLLSQELQTVTQRFKESEA